MIQFPTNSTSRRRDSFIRLIQCLRHCLGDDSPFLVRETVQQIFNHGRWHWKKEFNEKAIERNKQLIAPWIMWLMPNVSLFDSNVHPTFVHCRSLLWCEMIGWRQWPPKMRQISDMVLSSSFGSKIWTLSCVLYKACTRQCPHIPLWLSWNQEIIWEPNTTKNTSPKRGVIGSHLCDPNNLLLVEVTIILLTR